MSFIRDHLMSRSEQRIHPRLAIGGVILRTAFFARLYLLDGGTYFSRG